MGGELEGVGVLDCCDNLAIRFNRICSVRSVDVSFE